MQNQDSHSQVPYVPPHHNLPNAPIFSAVRSKPSFQKPISDVSVIINQSHQHRAQTELEREGGEREMKGTAMAANGTSSSVLGGGGGRSESDKEKTKMRERQRRAITGKIFHGLRKHGGYRLSPRADINEVLRHLAREAGWIVEPDGTTFRSNVGNCCPMCGEARSRASAPPTPTSSVVLAGGGGGGGGESSTTASPRRFAVGDPAIAAPSSTLCNVSSSGMSSVDGEIPMAALYSMYGGFSGGFQQYSSAVFHGEGASPAAFQQHQLQEARASNQNTPVRSPMHRA